MILVQGGSSGGFYIGKTEVTQSHWEAVMGNNPSYFKGSNLPVESVSWFESVEFCNKLSDLEGLKKAYTISGTNVTCNFESNGYRLPTKPEWEYAAKGGNKSRGYHYSGSNNVNDVAWQSGDNWGSLGSTKPVSIKMQNELGIYDMSGNVWEWCWDWFKEGSRRVTLGGSWRTESLYCSSVVSDRSIMNPACGYDSSLTPDSRTSDLGFRIARSK
jgi:formylglycine-generating enzyme